MERFGRNYDRRDEYGQGGYDQYSGPTRTGYGDEQEGRFDQRPTGEYGNQGFGTGQQHHQQTGGYGDVGGYGSQDSSYGGQQQPHRRTDEFGNPVYDQRGAGFDGGYGGTATEGAGYGAPTQGTGYGRNTTQGAGYGGGTAQGAVYGTGEQYGQEGLGGKLHRSGSSSSSSSEDDGQGGRRKKGGLKEKILGKLPGHNNA